MGNFSVSHYSRLYFQPDTLQLTYVLDLAEIPAFQLLGQWRVDWKDQDALSEKSRQEANEWMKNVALVEMGSRVPLRVKSVSTSAVEGAGGMPVLRIAIAAEASLQPGNISFEDRNFPGRAGWKEIVVDHGRSALIQNSSHGQADLSKALTYYPTDPAIAPPQDLTARVDWSLAKTASTPSAPLGTVTGGTKQARSMAAHHTSATLSSTSAAKVAKPVESVSNDSKPPSFSEQQPGAPGTVVRGDFLSRMLQRKNLTGGVILLGILVAFGLGAIHAMSPGHGKTIVAAYLVGTRGTLKQAGLLGLVVTFTHTFTVFMLGLGMLFFQQYVVAEKIVPVLGAISGLSIVGIGLMLLYQRATALLHSGAGHSHSHDGYFLTHDHDHAVPPSYFGAEEHALAGNLDVRPARTRIGELRAAEAREMRSGGSSFGNDHVTVAPDTEAGNRNRGYVHSHGGSTHSHAIETDITPRSLIALGVSGGLVPCPSALILMLSAIALGRPGLGLVLLVGFSSGLALVLMSFGMLAIYAKHMVPSSEETMAKPFFRLIPVFSAVVVICLGLVMTAVSAGWILPLRFLS